MANKSTSQKTTVSNSQVNSLIDDEPPAAGSSLTITSPQGRHIPNVEIFPRSPSGIFTEADSDEENVLSARLNRRYGLNIDEILDCANKFPKYKNYFKEKLGHVKRLNYLLDHPPLRNKGENEIYLRWWANHYSRQINNVLAWLNKEK